MRHTLRLNVSRKGYTLFSGQWPSPYRMFPLDVPSDGISGNYLAAQRRIDTMFATRLSRWHFSVSNVTPGERPVALYGCLLPIEDDQGRSGISFVHAIESDDHHGMDAIVVRLVESLSHPAIEEISDLLGGLARGSVNPQRTIDFLIRRFAEPLPPSAPTSTRKRRPVREIKHDCGGASAVAWLAMTMSHLDDQSPWEIYEVYSRQTGVVSTVSSCTNASVSYSLSTYLVELVHDHQLLEDLYTLRSGKGKDGSPPQAKGIGSALQSPFGDRSGHDIPDNTSMLPDDQSVRVMTESHGENAVPSESDRPRPDIRAGDLQQEVFSTDGKIVRFDGLYGRDLVLVGRTDRYRLNSANCVAFTGFSRYYELVLVLSKWWGLRYEKTRLVLPKEGLTEQQKQDVARFEGYLKSMR